MRVRLRHWLQQKGCDVVPGSPLTTKTTAVPAKDPLSSVGINGREREGETKQKQKKKENSFVVDAAALVTLSIISNTFRRLSLMVGLVGAGH